MKPPSPYNDVRLIGDGVIRGATLVLPTQTVQDLLPHGLVLGPQTLTPPGTHPVVLFFNDLFRAHMNIPTLLPNMTYHEQVVGVPFAYVTRSIAGPSGPFFFMPQLWLDNVLATLGGLLFWGFAKRLARFTVTADRYAAVDESGRPLISLDFEPVGEPAPLSQFPLFEPLRQLMDQPLVSQLPAAMGPLFACSDFAKNWHTARVRPLRSAVHIARAFVPGLPCGRFPETDLHPGIDESPFGAYEIHSQWSQGLIYPCAIDRL